MKRQSSRLLRRRALGLQCARQVCALLALMVAASGLMVQVAFAQSTSPASSGGPESLGSPGPVSSSRDASTGTSLEGVPAASGAVSPQKIVPAVKESVPKKKLTLKEALATRGGLRLSRDSSLEGAIYTIGELWEINIVSGKLEGQVNGVFRDTPLHEILDAILLSNGYGYRLAGESLVISRLNEMGQVNPFFESATIQVKAAKVSEVVEGVKSLKSPQGKVVLIESARTIFVMDFPERVEMMRRVVESIDAATTGAYGTAVGASPTASKGPPLEVASYRTQNIAVAEAEAAVTAVLSSDGHVTALDAEDRLVIVDYPQNVAMAQRLLRSVDVARPMVKITALIYDISVEDIEQLGLNWRHDAKGRVDANGDGQSVFSIDSILKSPLTSGGTFTFMNLSRHFDLTAVILALQNAKDSRLLASPFVVVEENEQALFESVKEIPYQQLTQTAAGGNLGTTAFKKAGITLRVTPKISADGTIKMVVNPEFSSLAGFTPGDNQPIIDTRTSTTTLRVTNKQTVVIGGLRQRNDIGDFKGIPHLKDMKYLGKLFRARDTTVRESELVVFIVPEIVGCSNPLSYREQLASDTIGCRLNGIPLAEGCVRRLPGCCDATSGCIDSEYDSSEYDSSEYGSSEYGAPEYGASEFEMGPNLAPEAESLPSQTLGIRRLPPVGPIPPTAVANGYRRPLVDKHLPGPLRPHFSQRYRAANGPRTATNPGSAYSEQPEQGKPSFWNRVLRR